jgi:hypothetical protein
MLTCLQEAKNIAKSMESKKSPKREKKKTGFEAEKEHYSVAYITGAAQLGKEAEEVVLCKEVLIKEARTYLPHVIGAMTAHRNVLSVQHKGMVLHRLIVRAFFMEAYMIEKSMQVRMRKYSYIRIFHHLLHVYHDTHT